MSKRAAEVQLTSDNYEEDEKDCDKVRQAFSTRFVWWALFSIKFRPSAWTVRASQRRGIKTARVSTDVCGKIDVFYTKLCFQH